MDKTKLIYYLEVTKYFAIAFILGISIANWYDAQVIDAQLYTYAHQSDNRFQYNGVVYKIEQVELNYTEILNSINQSSHKSNINK